MTPAVREFHRLVAGEWRAGGPLGITVHNPADVRLIVGTVPAMTAHEVTELYDAAEQGARTWRSTSVIARGEVLSRAADLLRDRAEQITTDLVAEMGKTTAEARTEVTKAADFLDYYAGLARLPQGDVLPDTRPQTHVHTRLEPVGIVALVTPWNDPLLTPARKLAPALVTGNAVLLKPATETPIVAVHLAKALDDAGLPPGVLGLVTGHTSEISEALLDDDRLAALSFTGSTAVGRMLQVHLAGRSVRVQTEMGGKNASVVLADADIELAVSTIFAASFGQSGQRCTATSRVIVVGEVADQLVSGLVAAARQLHLGPGTDPATTMGPLVSKAHQDEVLTHIQRATAEGAKVVLGGRVPDGDGLAHGCFIEATLLTGVHRSMSIWKDEVFGPVVAVHVVADEAEALEAANDSSYGLAASVFTRSLARAYRFIDAMEAGQVSVNLPTSGWDVHLPFGGFRDSGSPFKEQGLEALSFYRRVKTVALRTSGNV